MRIESIYINGSDKTSEIQSFSFVADKCLVIFKNSNKQYSYERSKVQIVKSAIQSKRAEDVFVYLTEIAATIGIKLQEGKNILAESYHRISFIPEYTILSNYLNGKQPNNGPVPSPIEIFPFGFNLSQKESVNNAFTNPLSVIEGPPGTGKTQTILNIIANAVMNEQSVAVVSSNNAATKNVYEKLENNGLHFLAALLGSSQNKREFIESQLEIPDLSTYRLSNEKLLDLQQKNSNLFAQLTENLAKKNELATLKLEKEGIETEYQHFLNNVRTAATFTLRSNISSDRLLVLWNSIVNQEQSGKQFSWWKKLGYLIRYRITNADFYKCAYVDMIKIVQEAYYRTRLIELELRIGSIENVLHRFSFDSKMKEYTEISMRLFKSKLYKRYKGTERTRYTESELRSRSEKFINDYPVIMSTTYSLRRCLAEQTVYDFVIIDESSQVDLATGVLVLSCAKRAVIVGDLKQLPNVVDDKMAQKTDAVFQSFKLPEQYRYSNHSLLLSITELFPDVHKTLLKEHYRCHPKIIDFCNKKFYNNQLIILSDPKSTREPLLVYKTVAGNHARERMNQRQIDVIAEEIIPQLQLESVNLGIVTPYRKQTEALQSAFESEMIKADTVDKFQGRENDVIIISTVDNEITEFTDNANRMNVAISRAIDQLIVLVHGNESEKDSNISDLLRYIEYNNFVTVNSSLHSIFDYLYKGYEEKRKKILSQKNIKSVFDSENLMYTLVRDILSQDRFSKYDVILHFPLRSLIMDFSLLTDDEAKYAGHHLTHVDFLIYNSLGKKPVLAIEVDGYAYHSNEEKQMRRDNMKNIILKKYNLPLLRFSTTGSGEREQLVQKLSDITK
ncbi:AAA domain-containing protein [Sphingobacterium sp. UDSM-2020]|uniref:AAA domain-containing protein n=1 Tax=Sphingobacterium sp. UDSM-2020 TaxID=2795738 RepID=UPI001937C33A|nr:AAA domain-containing protein [Sphingobacterium sp. UDSM-2020]QQD13411.1 AAA family ATPase [Sphingobacterium sp. UDSM-2020]